MTVPTDMRGFETNRYVFKPCMETGDCTVITIGHEDRFSESSLTLPTSHDLHLKLRRGYFPDKVIG